MRRLLLTLLSVGTTLLCSTAYVSAQQTSPALTAPGQDLRAPQLPQADRQANSLQLQKLSVPAAHAKSIATKLSIQYRDVAGVKIAPDAQNQQLVVMAPAEAQRAIANDVQTLLATHRQQEFKAGPLQVGLSVITWREFEDSLQKLSKTPLSVTTSRNGELAAFQLTAAPMQDTTIKVDRRNNIITVAAPQPSQPGWEKLIKMLDQTPQGGKNVTELLRLENSEPAPIQRALRLLRELEADREEVVAAQPVGLNSPFRNAVFQQNAGDASQPSNQPQAGDAAAPQDGLADDLPEDGEEGGAGVIGDTQIQFVPELGTIIIRGAKRDVERVMEVIKQIEEQSEITKPDVEVVELEYADANAVAELLGQLYEDVLSARQGEVSITSLDVPNALLLIGRTEAIAGLRELIEKIDQPVAESSRLRVFRLQNASAVDAEQVIRDFFTDRPGAEDDLRPGVGPRVRVLADYRTNSLIISAAPRDMTEVTRLINELDVTEIKAQDEIKVFPLSNAVAEDLAPVIQEAINGEAENVNENVTTPSTTLSIVAVDADNNRVLDSGILVGAVVTADSGANALVVRAPAASMPLIAELIRQLDKAPGLESLVKVFTVENGDATQLTTALRDLFGEDAATSGTSVGAGNLPANTAGSESSLVPLRFSTDTRTNSIIASGSAEDLEVVESILLRLDSTGFAERITEVIWLRYQSASDVAAALQTYVQQRTQTANIIPQFQQGLGPYDLPDRDLIVVAEPVSNSILLSVSPRLYEDVRRLIDKLDRRPPMVLIKVMIAEVRLDDTFEIGGEVGLQDALLFDRGIAAAAAGNPQSVPGFNFNDVGLPNANSLGAGSLATQGVTTFGVGTTNSNLGYGGFVLSAASESVNLLLRTLQDASRLQILSRPQIMTMDNTEGFVQVGRVIARVTDVINNGVAGTQVVTEDVEVGLIMNVRPRVGSDGLIIMDIDATRSDRDDANGTLVPTGDGGVVLINDILRTTAQSVVAAYSGQTVVFGGLIQKTRANFSRRVPYVADIPLLGHFFKYDQETEIRSELLVILTPMLVTGEEDLDYVKQVESSRMSWCLADVVEAHGDVGLSGGYGLWGPAVGHTIYPDLTPTIDEVIIEESTPGVIPGEGAVEITPAAPLQPAVPNLPMQPEPVFPAPATPEPVFPPTTPGVEPIEPLDDDGVMLDSDNPLQFSNQFQFNNQGNPPASSIIRGVDEQASASTARNSLSTLPPSRRWQGDSAEVSSAHQLPDGNRAPVAQSTYQSGSTNGSAAAPFSQTSWIDVINRANDPSLTELSDTEPSTAGMNSRPARLGSVAPSQPASSWPQPSTELRQSSAFPAQPTNAAAPAQTPATSGPVSEFPRY